MKKGKSAPNFDAEGFEYSLPIFDTLPIDPIDLDKIRIDNLLARSFTRINNNTESAEDESDRVDPATNFDLGSIRVKRSFSI